MVDEQLEESALRRTGGRRRAGGRPLVSACAQRAGAGHERGERARRAARRRRRFRARCDPGRSRAPGRTRSAAPAPHDRRAAPRHDDARPCRGPCAGSTRPSAAVPRPHADGIVPPVTEARCAGVSSKRGSGGWRRCARTATLTSCRSASPSLEGDGGDVIVSGTDEKPKTTYALRRLRNIAEHSGATLLVDHYEEEWERVWWVRVDGRGRCHRRRSANGSGPSPR